MPARLAHKLPPFRGEMFPTLERAIYELYGERISRTAWDLRAVPAYLDFTFRVVDDHDRVLGTSRDLADLQRTYGQRAKEVWATVPRESFERTNLRTWDFGEAPRVRLDHHARPPRARLPRPRRDRARSRSSSPRILDRRRHRHA